jgi:molybdopterin converting factor small subunit
MRINFFGELGERLGRSVELDIPAEVGSVAALRRLLAVRFPDAAASLASPSLRACIGDEIVTEDHDIQGYDLVEFFPPLSGG